MKSLTLSKENLFNNQHHLVSHNSTNNLKQKQPSSLLKHQILQIIKGELKNFKVRTELLNELSEHQKKQKNKQLSKEIFQSKMQAHQQNERIRKNKKLQEFQKKQKERQQKLKAFKTIKQKQHEEKFESIKRMLQVTKTRYHQITNEDSNLRLSKLMVYTSCDKKVRENQNSRQSKTSYSQSRHYDFSKPDESQRQNSLVTSYINKIKRSQSRILQKELEKDKRKQTGKKQKVKCFVVERAKHQLQKMEKTEKQYKTRMQTFQNNNFKISQSRLIQQENRSLTNLNHSRLVSQRRQRIKKQKVQSFVPQIDTCSKHPLQYFRQRVENINDSRLLQLNLKKMRDEESALKEQATLKLIADKLQKIKDLKYGERLDVRSVKILLQILDRNDPEYSAIAEFLQTERKSYLQALAKKEQERSKLQKNKKNNKALGKSIS